MEVTRTNFQKVLEELDSVLENASFLGIDGEFTGLNSGPDASAFDTPAQYYAKLRSGSMDFLLVQFGLSVFTYSSERNRYLQQSYNFYAFPRPLNRAAPDCRFMCQASSISFLADSGFDFNKLFNEGIPYLTSAEEERLSKKIEDRQKAREDNLELIPIPEDDRPQIEEICSRIDEFLSSEAEELVIDRCNAFIRRIIHQEARMRWPNKLRLEGKSDSSGQCLVVQRTGTKEEEEKREAERREKEQNEIKQAVGLSALLRKIADSGKLIVGHNMLLDLCHIVHQFFAPLPESYYEFKALIHCLFPKLLDTKVMCQSPQFRESVPFSILNALHETVSKPPFCVPEMDTIPDRSYSSLVDKSHEAGYDAYITGLCFVSLSNYLGTLQKPELSTVLPDSPLLNPFINKLLISRLKDFPYIDLVAKDPNPSRDHVFYITFPKEWKLSDIYGLFSSFGGVYVSFLSDTSAYVGLNRRDQAAAVNKHNFTVPNFRLQKYAEHQAEMEAKNFSPAQGDRKRKLSASDNSSPAKDQERIKKPEPNGEESSSIDEGWEMASGNAIINVPSICQKYHFKHGKQRADYCPAPTPVILGSSNIFERFKDELGFKSQDRAKEQIKSVEKLRLKNTMSLPSDFRAPKYSKKEIPKYTILRRSPDQIDIRNIIENSHALRPSVKRFNEEVNKTSEKIGDAENIGCLSKVEETESTGSSADLMRNGKIFEIKKQTLARAKSNPIYSDRLKTVPEKSDSSCCASISTSQKKFVKSPGSTPSASPKAKRSPNKKHAKQKSSDFTSSTNLVMTGDNQRRELSNVEKAKNLEKSNNERLGFQVKDDYSLVKRRERTLSEDKIVELKKPSMKLLRGARKRSENVILTGSLVFRVAQIVGVLLLLYVIILF